MTYRVERAQLGRKIVIKTDRKEGNGAKGGGRKGNTGKKATVYQVDNGGAPIELAECRGSTFTDLKRNLYKTGFVPNYVEIKKSEETLF